MEPKKNGETPPNSEATKQRRGQKRFQKGIKKGTGKCGKCLSPTTCG
jgi:hypothetical protein